MQIRFVERSSGPERLVCEAEIHFDESGPLAGLKLVGFSLWHGTAGTMYVTFPSRAFGAGNDRRFFDYLRPTDARDAQAAVRLKQLILDTYQARSSAG